MERAKTRRWKRWLIIGSLGAVALIAGGPWVYFNVIRDDAPPPLTLSTSSPTSGTTDGTFTAEGTWKVTGGSQVGYRVKEVIFGQSQDAVGRTAEVTGSITVSGTVIQSGSFTADLTAVTSDETRRDNQFHGRIMNTARFPTATFTLTEPIDFGSVPSDGVTKTYRVTGDFAMHGVTNRVTFDLSGRRNGAAIQVSGSIPVVFADWDIGNPSFGPVTTEDRGVMEFLLVLSRS